MSIQEEQRFSENKYSIAVYTAVFSLEDFCCILYDVLISPALSELPHVLMVVYLSVTLRTKERILNLEYVCRVSLECLVLAV